MSNRTNAVKIMMMLLACMCLCSTSRAAANAYEWVSTWDKIQKSGYCTDMLNHVKFELKPVDMTGDSVHYINIVDSSGFRGKITVSKGWDSLIGFYVQIPYTDNAKVVETDRVSVGREFIHLLYGNLFDDAKVSKVDDFYGEGIRNVSYYIDNEDIVARTITIEFDWRGKVVSLADNDMNRNLANGIKTSPGRDNLIATLKKKNEMAPYGAVEYGITNRYVENDIKIAKYFWNIQFWQADTRDEYFINYSEDDDRIVSIKKKVLPKVQSNVLKPVLNNNVVERPSMPVSLSPTWRSKSDELWFSTTALWNGLPEWDAKWIHSLGVVKAGKEFSVYRPIPDLRVLNNHYLRPSFSPDGNKVAFINNGNIAIEDMRNNSVLIHSGAYRIISRLCWNGNDSIVLYDVNAKRAVKLDIPRNAGDSFKEYYIDLPPQAMFFETEPGQKDIIRICTKVTDNQFEIARYQLGDVIRINAIAKNGGDNVTGGSFELFGAINTIQCNRKGDPMVFAEPPINMHCAPDGKSMIVTFKEHSSRISLADNKSEDIPWLKNTDIGNTGYQIVLSSLDWDINSDNSMIAFTAYTKDNGSAGVFTAKIDGTDIKPVCPGTAKDRFKRYLLQGTWRYVSRDSMTLANVELLGYSRYPASEWPPSFVGPLGR